MRQSIVGVVAVLTLFAGLAVAGDRPNPDYFADIRASFPNVFIVRIESGRIAPEAECKVFKYHARVAEQVRGNYQSAHFDFSTISGLKLGGEYLVYFDDEALRRARPVRLPGIDNRTCESKGYFVPYNWIHAVTTFTQGPNSDAVRVVAFSDILQDYPESESYTKVERFVDLRYLRQQLNR